MFCFFFFFSRKSLSSATRRQVACKILSEVLWKKKRYLWFYMTQIVHSNGKILFLSPMNCFYGVMLMFSFFFLQGKVLCFGTCWQVAFLDHVYFMSKKIIFQMHFLLEGIVEASLPGSNWQKTVNFLFNGKILSPSNKYSVSQFSVKVPMKWKIIAAYFTGFSKK